VAWVGDTFRATERLLPTFEPICGYLGHPTHAKYRSVKTAVATHEALVVPPPLVPAWAWRPQRALVSPVPCVSRRRIILHHTSCQPAPWAPRCRHPSPPPPLTAGAPPPRTRALPTASIFIDRRRPCDMVGRGAPPGGGGDGAWGGGQLEGVARTQVAAVCRCGEVESSNRLDRYLGT